MQNSETILTVVEALAPAGEPTEARRRELLRLADQLDCCAVFAAALGDLDQAVTHARRLGAALSELGLSLDDQTFSAFALHTHEQRPGRRTTIEAPDPLARAATLAVLAARHIRASGGGQIVAACRRSVLPRAGEDAFAFARRAARWRALRLAAACRRAAVRRAEIELQKDRAFWSGEVKAERDRIADLIEQRDGATSAAEARRLEELIREHEASLIEAQAIARELNS